MNRVEGLDVKIHHEPASIVVRLVGNGSNVYGDQIRDEMQGALTHMPAKVVLDLSRLTFINSVLVGVIVEFVVRVHREQVKMEIHEARGQVLDVLRACNVAKLLRFDPVERPHVRAGEDAADQVKSKAAAQ